jgi:hypothetical protein
MTICPIAIAVGCQKCPVFKICPLKGVIGDQPKASDVMPEVKAPAKTPAKRAAKPRTAAARKKK